MSKVSPRIVGATPISPEGNVEALQYAITTQIRPPDAVEDGPGVRPSGIICNQAVAAMAGETPLFIDGSALPGTADLAKQLVPRLLKDLTTSVSRGVL